RGECLPISCVAPLLCLALQYNGVSRMERWHELVGFGRVVWLSWRDTSNVSDRVRILRREREFLNRPTFGAAEAREHSKDTALRYAQMWPLRQLHVCVLVHF